MNKNQPWIRANDKKLIASVIRHEGDKSAIYRAIDCGVLKVALGCDYEHCKQKDLWPAYIDTEGHDTVGVGHLINGEEDYLAYAGVDDETVMRQLAEDLEKHLSSAVAIAREYEMNIDGHYDVQRFMVEMCFNIGQAGYGKFRKGLEKLASAINGDGRYTFNDAADEHLDSKWAKQVKYRAQDMVDQLRILDRTDRDSA